MCSLIKFIRLSTWLMHVRMYIIDRLCRCVNCMNDQLIMRVCKSLDSNFINISVSHLLCLIWSKTSSMWLRHETWRNRDFGKEVRAQGIVARRVIIVKFIHNNQTLRRHTQLFYTLHDLYTHCATYLYDVLQLKV